MKFSAPRSLAASLPDNADASLKWMLGYWEEKRGDLVIPRRQAIDPADFTKLLPLIYILEGTSLPELYVKLAGTAYRNLYGFEVTGRRLVDLIPSDSGLLTLSDYRTSLTRRQPVYREGEMTWRQRNTPVLYQRLLLPMADKADQIRFILGIASIMSNSGQKLNFNF